MNTNMLKNIGIWLCLIVTLVLTSCQSAPRPRRGYGPPPGYQPQPNNNAQFDQGGPGYSTAPSGSPENARLNAAKGFIKILATEKLAPYDPTPERYLAIVGQDKRFRRDSDGVITFDVLKTVASGGIIGWSGRDYGFEGPVEETTGIHDRLSVRDVALACVKYRKRPPNGGAGSSQVRAEVERIETSRGYRFQ